MERRTVTEFVRAQFDRLRRDYPNAHRLLVGEKRADLLLLRVLLLTLYGLAVGFLFYRLVLVNLDLPDTVLFYLGLSVALALGKMNRFFFTLIALYKDLKLILRPHHCFTAPV